jgi:hypothetical protein
MQSQSPETYLDLGNNPQLFNLQAHSLDGYSIVLWVACVSSMSSVDRIECRRAGRVANEVLP